MWNCAYIWSWNWNFNILKWKVFGIFERFWICLWSPPPLDAIANCHIFNAWILVPISFLILIFKMELREFRSSDITYSIEMCTVDGGRVQKWYRKNDFILSSNSKTNGKVSWKSVWEREQESSLFTRLCVCVCDGVITHNRRETNNANNKSRC